MFSKLKLNKIQQLSNFKNNLRIEHQKKLKNLFKKINLQNLIDQVINFERSETLAKTYKKNKFNNQTINNNEQKNIEKGDSKRFCNEREKKNRKKKSKPKTKS